MKLCLVCNFQTTEDQETCPRDGSSMVTVGDDPLIGEVVEGRYKIQSVIGQGSAGTVYKAVQELIGREVAIKVLHDYLVSDEEFIKRFRQEAKASSRLSHPNIITIYDFGVIPQGNRPYIAMDLLVGTPLSDLLAQEERLPYKEAIPIFIQVASALGEAHREGVVHRDVKPENIVLVERSGQKLFPMMVDFGIARIVEESDAAKITRTGTVCGSPTYMSPEQCTSSKVDNRSDIYSLAVVVYETLTGEVPFHSDELVRVMAMHLSDPPTPLNQVKPGLRFPDELEECVYKALAKSPDQRYQTMEEFAEALEAAMNQPVASPTKRSTSQSLPHSDIEPGPLAQDDSLKPQHTNTGEVNIPGRSTRDLANRALEEFQTRTPNPDDHTGSTTNAASVQAQVEAMRSQIKHDRAEAIKQQGIKSQNFSRGRGGASPADLLRRALPIGLGVLGVGALFFSLYTFGGKFDLSGLMPEKENPPEVVTVEAAKEAIAKGKLSDAIAIMEALQKEGKLKGKGVEKLNEIYVNQGKYFQKQGQDDNALDVLTKVDKDSAYYKEAQSLIKSIDKDDDDKGKDSGSRRKRRRR